MFQIKWDRILWVDHFLETNNALPTAEEVAAELEVSTQKAAIYLSYYDSREVFLEEDLKDLMQGFDVHQDCVIWWTLIIQKLKSYPSKSLWVCLANRVHQHICACASQ